MHITKKLVAGIIVILAIAAGSTALAAVPDGGGAIHGCYSPNGALATNGTQLNILDRASAACSKGQTEVTWNQQGPPGAQGPKGDKGDQGPSDGWDTGSFGATVPIGGAETTFGTATTPAGNYVLSGAVRWEALASGGASLFCRFATSGATASLHGAWGVASTAGGGSMPLTGDMVVDAGGTATVSLLCKQESGNAPVVVYGVIQAIRVGTLHT